MIDAPRATNAFSCSSSSGVHGRAKGGISTSEDHRANRKDGRANPYQNGGSLLRNDWRRFHGQITRNGINRFPTLDLRNHCRSCQCRQPSLSTSVLKPSGRGAAPSSTILQALQGHTGAAAVTAPKLALDPWLGCIQGVVCVTALARRAGTRAKRAPRCKSRGPFRSDRIDYLGVPASLDGSPTGPLLFEGGKLGEPFGPVSDDRVEPVPMPVVPCMAVPRAGEPLPTCCEPFELPLRSVIPP